LSGKQPFPVAGKRVLVTGGTAGLGFAMARALLEGGARLAITGRDEERGGAAERNLRSFGDCLFLRHDAAEEASWAEVLDTVRHRLGGLDAVINNVGVNEVRPIALTSYADFLRLARINLHSAWLGTYRGGALIADSGGGAVVNIGSMAARYAHPQVAPYCTAKAMVAGLSKAAARHFEARGVRVNTIHPGIFLTELTERTAFSDDAARAAQIARIPAARFGDPAELGPLALFLVSEASQGLTGSEFVADGGRTAW